MIQWRASWRDAVELWLLPGWAAVLPWRLCFALFKIIARSEWLYREPVRAACEQAQALGWLSQEEAPHWRYRRRLITLVDHADLFLANTRSDAFLRRHVSVQGHWPMPGQTAVLCTFHWGAGMWGLRDAHAHGLHGHALAAVPQREHLRGRPLLWWYAQWRTRTSARALGGEIVDVNASMKGAVRHLADGGQLVAVVDVPADAVDGSLLVELLGRRMAMPRGLLRLAAQRQLPVVCYYTGLDMQSGRRYIGIEPALTSTSAQALAREVFMVLDRIIRTDTAAWHFWGQMPRFLAMP